MPKDFREPTLFRSVHGLLSRQTIRMVDTSRRGRVGLGLIGLGPRWEQVYRDALVRLQNRLTIRVVYDSVEGRARSVANDVGAPVAGSLRQVLQNGTLQGLLVLDPGWCGTGALSLIARTNKPVFLGCPMLKNVLGWRSLIEKSNASKSSNAGTLSYDDLLMPELGLRFTPASCRLRELIVTQLGPARMIEIECDLSEEIQYLAALIDWCSSLLGDDPVSLYRNTSDLSGGSSFDLEYPRSSSTADSSGTSNRTAKFRQRSSDDLPLKINVECERGEATLIQRTHISWRTSSEWAQESLMDERTETEILIDQFCRRALGGLNPVGQLSELIKAMDLVQSIRNGTTQS